MPDQLKLDAFVAPMRPMQGAAAQGAGDDPMWSPMSSTLIHGASEPTPSGIGRWPGR